MLSIWQAQQDGKLKESRMTSPSMLSTTSLWSRYDCLHWVTWNQQWLLTRIYAFVSSYLSRPGATTFSASRACSHPYYLRENYIRNWTITYHEAIKEGKSNDYLLFLNHDYLYVSNMHFEWRIVEVFNFLFLVQDGINYPEKRERENKV